MAPCSSSSSPASLRVLPNPHLIIKRIRVSIAKGYPKNDIFAYQYLSLLLYEYQHIEHLLKIE